MRIKYLERRLRAIEDRLEIYNLIAGHPPSADTGAAAMPKSVYTEDGVFDRGPGLTGATGNKAMGAAADKRRATRPPSPAGSPILPACRTSRSTATSDRHLLSANPDAEPIRRAGRGAQPRHFARLSHPPRGDQPLGTGAHAGLEDQAAHPAPGRRLASVARAVARRARRSCRMKRATPARVHATSARSRRPDKPRRR